MVRGYFKSLLAGVLLVAIVALAPMLAGYERIAALVTNVEFTAGDRHVTIAWNNELDRTMSRRVKSVRHGFSNDFGGLKAGDTVGVFAYPTKPESAFKWLGILPLCFVVWVAVILIPIPWDNSVTEKVKSKRFAPVFLTICHAGFAFCTLFLINLTMSELRSNVVSAEVSAVERRCFKIPAHEKDYEVDIPTHWAACDAGYGFGTPTTRTVYALSFSNGAIDSQGADVFLRFFDGVTPAIGDKHQIVVDPYDLSRPRLVGDTKPWRQACNAIGIGLIALLTALLILRSTGRSMSPPAARVGL